jgi:Fe-S cluster assembly protein SufD
MKISEGRATLQGVEEFLSRAQALESQGPQYLQELRSTAREKLQSKGFPTPRDEEWKYTDITPVTHFTQAPTSVQNLNGAAPLAGKYLHSQTRLAFVNGEFSRELSQTDNLPEGVTIGDLASHFEHSAVTQHLGQYAGTLNDDAPTALNSALLQNGAFIHVASNAQLAEVDVLFLSVGDGKSSTQPRVLVVAERGAQLSLVETHTGSGSYFSNALTEIFAGENAQVDHNIVLAHSDEGLHIGTLQVEARRDARVSSHALNLSGRLLRHNANARMGGENVHVTLNGIVLGRGEQHIDNHTAMDHALPHCTSHEGYAHILDGKSTAVFNGKIYVRPDAQKTDAVQSNRTLLLSNDATINTKPQLEIFADDVKCTHGATIGQMDEAALFYLRARGIGEKQAQALMTHAFANEVLQEMRHEWLHELVEQELSQRI